MANRTIEAEADTLEEARAKLKAQTPEGYQLVSEKILSDGAPKTVEGVGDTSEEAFAKARAMIPAGASVLESRERQPAEHKAITVEASSEAAAYVRAVEEARKQYGSFALVHSVKLSVPGKKGVMGIGKKPDQYQVDVRLWEAIAEVSYRLKARVSATLEPVAAPDYSPVQAAAANQFMEVEADSLEEARAKIKAQTPAGYKVQSEQVISDGAPKTLQIAADTGEAALAKAQSEIPAGASITDYQLVVTVVRRAVAAEAFDPETAKVKAQEYALDQWGAPGLVQSVTLAAPGQQGEPGAEKQPDQYRVELLLAQQGPTTWDVEYKPKARISATLAPIPAAEEVSPEVAQVLRALKSPDGSARVTALTQALPLLLKGEKGALEPFLVALTDKEQLVRMTAARIFSVMDENVLRLGVRTSKQRDRLVCALDELPTQFERDLAGSARQNVSRLKNLQETLTRYLCFHYLQTTIAVDQSTQDQIARECLEDIFPTNPQFIGSIVVRESGVGPANVEADAAFLAFLMAKKIKLSEEDRIFRNEGSAQGADGPSFDWVLDTCFVPIKE